MYKYHVRPCYGRPELLIEFSIDNEDVDFIPLLLQALARLQLKVEGVENLWMNDETLIGISSSDGDFMLSKDVWGFVFILANENQAIISRISGLLKNHPQFEKEDVETADFEMP